MSRRRSRLEIMLDILAAIKGGMDKPTRIMYASNMSWKPTQRVLSGLMEQGLIEMRITPGLSRKRYMITEKGVNVLDLFEKANEVLPREEYSDLYSTRAVPS
jgi:predicted transcriptional regulator